MNQTQLKLLGTEDFFLQEAYKVLRSNIQFCGPDIKTIAITSCHENEGKTCVSLHLGKSFAELGKKVLVIDADMRKSVMLGRNSSSKNAKGLSEVLSGLADVNECVYETQYEFLNIMFAGKYPPNPVELLNTTNFTDLLANARQQYDYIIIDLPPLGAVIDAAVVAQHCDGVALVISANNVKSSVAKEVLAQLKTSGSKVLGVIKNNTSNKKDSYYRYGYRKGYRGYYGRKYKAESSDDNNAKLASVDKK